jgi:predicted type IV restriction endonuclease
MKISKKVEERIQQRIKNFQTIAAQQKQRDVAEADTVTLVKDMLADLFGYDKYNELTSEQQIRATYCDLAVKIDGKIRYLIEVKSAGIDLNEAHLKQALNYGMNQGLEWVMLTNGLVWKTYKISYATKPYEWEEVTSFDLLQVNPKNEEDLMKMFLICREALQGDALSEYHEQIKTLNKFTIAQLTLSDAVVGAIRREMRRVFPEIKVEPEQIKTILEAEVLKREVVDGDKAKETQAKIKKVLAKIERDQAKQKSSAESIQKPDEAISDNS